MKTTLSITSPLQKTICGTLLCMLVCFSVYAETKHGKGMAIIGGKTLHSLLLDMHGFDNLPQNQILVTANSVFYNPEGNMISFKDLNVPCYAEIEYAQKLESAPEVVRVRVIEYDDNATPRFTVKNVEKSLPR